MSAPAPHPSSVELAERLGATSAVATVVANDTISPTLRSITLAHEDAVALAGEPGQDVMLYAGEHDGQIRRRRYSVRSVNAETKEFTLWIATTHDGPGANWAREAEVGSTIDVVGPRGKIPLDPLADWHIFMGGTVALGAFYRMAEAIEEPGRAIFIVEIPDPNDALTPNLPEGIGVTGIFIDRDGRAPSDPAGLLSGLAAFAFPPDTGHAYLFGEFSAVRAAKVALLDRGLTEEQISLKAFWRAGRGNADHGEPVKD